MDTLVVKSSFRDFQIQGSAEELMEIVTLLSSTSRNVELSFASALNLLYIFSGKTDFNLNEIKHDLFKEMQSFHMKLNIKVESHDKWAEQLFDEIDFNQEIESWSNRLPS